MVSYLLEINSTNSYYSSFFIFNKEAIRKMLLTTRTTLTICMEFRSIYNKKVFMSGWRMSASSMPKIKTGAVVLPHVD